jgi:FlaA1/EpsC-like NDP-sugar epimerase
VIEAGAAKLLALGRSENGVFEAVLDLQEVAGDCEIVPVICCVRDREALDRIFDQHHPDVIFHAAAHKHVPLMELYPAEAIKNNVIGTLNLVELAVTHGVGRFVLVSTDKAVHPSSIMGASKQVAERIVRAYAEETGASMVSVRFGNVLGSRGSVVPTMMRQIGRRLPVTVTHPDMIRYFMTIPEAVDLILQAGISVGHGETFILKMGHPVKIMDLACDLIRAAGLVPNIDIPVRIIGLRPGEKLSEDLLTEEEKGYAQVGEHFYVVPGGSLDFQYVKMAVEELRTAASNGDREAIIAVLGEIIPDFAPKGRVVRPEDPGDEAALDAIEEASR